MGLSFQIPKEITCSRGLNYASNNETALSVYPSLVLIKLRRRKSAVVLR